MHDAAHLAAKLGLDRHHVAAVAQRDNRLLQRVLGVGAQERLEPRLQPVVGDAHVVADDAQRRARAVQHLAAGVQGAADLLTTSPCSAIVAPMRPRRGSMCADAAQRAAGLLRRTLRRRDVEQLLGVQYAAQRRLLDRPAHVGAPARLSTMPPPRRRIASASVAWRSTTVVVIGRRPQREREVTAAAERAETRQPGDDLLVLKDAYRVLVHIEIDSNSEAFVCWIDGSYTWHQSLPRRRVNRQGGSHGWP